MKRITTLGLALGAAIAFAGTAPGPDQDRRRRADHRPERRVRRAAEERRRAGGRGHQRGRRHHRPEDHRSYGDDVSDPKQGVSVANKFVGDGVKFVVGHFNSGVTMPASEVYQENGILMITPFGHQPEDHRAQACGTCSAPAAVTISRARSPPTTSLKNCKGKKIAIVHDKTTYGQGLADETKKAMNKGGMKEVLYEGVNIGEKDFSALVSKIKASGADLVYWGGLHTEGGLIVRQMRDQGVKAPLMGGDGITSDEFASVGGPGVEGTLMTFAPDPRKRAEAKAIVEKFRAKKFEPEAYTLYSYAAVQMMKQAAEAGEVARSQEGRRGDEVRQEVQDRDRRAVASTRRATSPVPTT